MYTYVHMETKTIMKKLRDSKRQISGLVSTYGHFQRYFLKLQRLQIEYDVNYISFKMMISQLDNDLIATVKNEWTT